MFDPSKIALYVEGTFDIDNPTAQQLQQMETAADDLANSGFGTVILAFLHVHEGGAFYYNNIPFTDVYSFLPAIIQRIKATGSVNRVIVSLGPFGSDYAPVKANTSQFQQQFLQMASTLGLDGIDFDLEQDYEDYTDLLIELTNWAAENNLTVTAAPYQETAFWTTVLKGTTTNGTSNFSWWNLQIYGGANYSSWVQSLDGIVSSPESFLVPGYSVQYGATPPSIENILQGLLTSYPSLDGCFIWQYELIQQYNYTAAEFASAIKAGLGGQPSTASAAQGAESAQG